MTNGADAIRVDVVRQGGATSRGAVRRLMTRLRTPAGVCALAFAVVLVLALGGAMFSSPVMAQETPPGGQTNQNTGTAEATPSPTATSTPEPTISVTVTNDPTAIELDPQMAFAIVLALLVLAAFVLWKLFDYFSASRADYYTTVREFARKGVFFSPILVSATAPVPAALARLAEGEATPLPTRFELTGPGIMTTAEKAKFTATSSNGLAAATKWSIGPPAGGVEDAAPTLAATEGESVDIVATKRGAFVLTATMPAPDEAPGYRRSS